MTLEAGWDAPDLRDERVLVTGADGFIGSHLVEALVAGGALVRAFVWYDALGRRGWLDALPRETLGAVEVVPGDVRDAGSVDDAVRGAGVVFHLAALVGVPYSFRAPGAYVDTNVKGTLHVLDAARRHAVGRTLVVSSSEVYGSARATPMDESHPLCAQSPYAASKVGADALAESYIRSYDLPAVIARPFNVYGPRQSARAVIPAILTQLLSGADPVALGSLAPRRDFTFVSDTARALVALARCDRARGETVHIASGSDVSVGELFERLRRLVRPGASVRLDEQRVRPARSEVERLQGSAAKLRALTGWRPAWDLDRGLAETAAWFRDPANLSRYRSDIFGV